MAEHHTGDVKYGRTQKRQIGNETYTIVGRKSNNKKKVIAKRSGDNREKFRGKGKDIGK